MGMYIKALVLIILLFAAITFGTQNSDPVSLRYYFGLASTPVPLYLVIYVGIIVGIIAGMVMGITTRATLRSRAKKLEKSNALLREELEKWEAEAKKVAPSGATEPEIGTTQALPSREAEPGGEAAEADATASEPTDR
jgi:uncharacterized integral membrane protein